MNATVPASIGPDPARWVGACMLAGAALLGAGCWRGLAGAQERSLVLCLLGAGIAMFAAALVLLRRRPVHAPVAPAPAPAAAPIAGQKLLAAPVEPSPGADVGQALRHDLPAPAVEPRPAPPAAIVAAPRPMEGGLDVTALMDAPLADLLLAALCKDPVGARRIFARALEAGAPASAAP